MIDNETMQAVLVVAFVVAALILAYKKMNPPKSKSGSITVKEPHPPVDEHAEQALPVLKKRPVKEPEQFINH